MNELMGLLQRLDLPMDAEVVIEVGGDAVSAVVGHGRPSKLIITMG